MDTRIFVKKREAYRVEADSLFHELKTNLNLEGLNGVTLYNTYDVFHADENDIELLKKKVLSEVVTDDVFDSVDLEGKTYIAYECLPGQYDQRADSAQQCLMLLNNKSDVVIKSGRIVILEGEVTSTQLEAVKHYLINPVETREASMDKPETLVQSYDIPTSVITLEGFRDKDEEGLAALESVDAEMAREDREFGGF